jgi:TRAP-type mannitol/chloroaromatic compound transport system permease small subunit
MADEAGADGTAVAARLFAWSSIAAVSAFLLNNYLSHWRNWPGSSAIFGVGADGLAWMQGGLYVACLGVAAAYVIVTPLRRLRPEAGRIYAITAYIVRAAFWAVLLIGLADAAISFLRVEGLLPSLVGPDLATELGRARTRGIYVHFPLAGAGLIIAALTRGLGFHWLGLLVVGAELGIVVTRFVFSYEQAFMGDLVRFWYAALFLFASAYTLVEEGHVRVDVLYSLFPDRMRGLANAIGTVVLGMPLCWVAIVFGMRSKASVINSPLLNFEVTQTGFGMYVKYWMAGFLAIFAVSMLIQFSGYFLQAVADWRGEPGRPAAKVERDAAAQAG